ncbi:hypothetical protein AALB39_27435 [Lachnospiraceae bacterium 54-53]
MRKSSKEHKGQLARREKALQAETATMIKAPPVETFSAQMPAFTYTSLCLDPELREPLVKRKKVDHETGR